jgi:hypothetical protein
MQKRVDGVERRNVRLNYPAPNLVVIGKSGFADVL